MLCLVADTHFQYLEHLVIFLFSLYNRWKLCN